MSDGRKNNGGARANAGRKKAKPEEKRKRSSVYVTEEEFYAVKRFITLLRIDYETCIKFLDSLFNKEEKEKKNKDENKEKE